MIFHPPSDQTTMCRESLWTGTHVPSAYLAPLQLASSLSQVQSCRNVFTNRAMLRDAGAGSGTGARACGEQQRGHVNSKQQALVVPPLAGRLVACYTFFHSVHGTSTRRRHTR